MLIGALVFGLMGYPRAAFVGRTHRSKRVAVAVVALMCVVILVPLGTQSYSVWVDRAATGTATDAAEAWLAGSGYSLVSVKVDSAESALTSSKGRERSRRRPSSRGRYRGSSSAWT